MGYAARWRQSPGAAAVVLIGHEALATMLKSSLAVSAVALALGVLSSAPALAGSAGGGWNIDRGANASNVQVVVAPVPQDKSAAAAESGCAPLVTMGQTQYTFPSANGVTVIISPAYGPFFAPYASGIDGTNGYGYGSSQPRVVVWANPSTGTF